MLLTFEPQTWTAKQFSLLLDKIIDVDVFHTRRRADRNHQKLGFIHTHLGKWVLSTLISTEPF